MRVLVTGAFGNIGSNTVDALLERGAQVRALQHEKGDLPKKWKGKVEVVRGDVTRPETLGAAVRGVDVVVHLAYVIPPLCLEKPELARKVNVDGTANLIAAIKAQVPGAKLLFASSLDVFGKTAHLPPPRKLTDPVSASDVYTEHKEPRRLGAGSVRWPTAPRRRPPSRDPAARGTCGIGAVMVCS